MGLNRCRGPSPLPTLLPIARGVNSGKLRRVPLLCRAGTERGDERSRGWKKMAALYPPYDNYQKRAASRQIPVVVLEPIGPA